MDRRQFLGVACSTAVLLPLTVYAQKLARSPRIGYLSPARLPHLLEALHGGLRELGYIEGQNIVFDYNRRRSQKTLMNWLRAGAT
jgi:putative ABC transport system substrate-binding protein